jgi:glycosyltransferase involved in cell wall biosynthesis
MEEIVRIMIFDVPADSSGALTILKQYYDIFLKDTDKEYFFVVSTPKLNDHKNVKVLNFPWVKKSWFHRLYFDYVVAPKLVKKYEIDEILSLQNVIIPCVQVKQTLYLHQPLPFVEKKYRITENFKFWVYQNIISEMIFSSIKKADKVIVQTNWIKNACIKKIDVNPNKIELMPPKLNIKVKKYHESISRDKTLFFYPSSALEYKNHKLIIEAVSKLEKVKCREYEVILTLKGNENSNIKELFRRVQAENLPIKFIGSIKIDEVYEYYSKSTLIFPSYIETFGLPLLEAKVHRSPIIASDCAFSHEILDDYEHVNFFNPFDVISLYQILKLQLIIDLK